MHLLSIGINSDIHFFNFTRGRGVKAHADTAGIVRLDWYGRAMGAMNPETTPCTQ